MIRCLETAQGVCKTLPRSQINVDENICEVLHPYYYERYFADEIVLRKADLLAKYMDPCFKLNMLTPVGHLKDRYPEEWDTTERFVPYMDNII